MNLRNIFLPLMAFIALSSNITTVAEEFTDFALDKTHTSPELKKTFYINGIFVTGKKEELLYEGRKGLTDVQISHLDVPGGEEGLKQTLKPLIGKPLNKESFDTIRTDIKNYYRRNDHHAVSVNFALRNTGGVVQVIVTPKTKKPLTIKGIYVTGKKENLLAEGRKGLSEIRIDDLEVPGGTEALQRVLKPFQGQPIKKETYNAIRDAIKKYYKDINHSHVAVNFAPKSTGGIIQLSIVPKKKKPKIVKTSSLSIKGIYISGKSSDILKKGRKDVKGIEIHNLKISDEETNGLKDLLTPYLGQKITKDELTKLREDIINSFILMGKDNISVKFYPKSVGGVIQVLVTTKTVKKGAKKTAKKPVKKLLIKGMVISGYESDLLECGRADHTGIQIMNLVVPCGEQYLISVLQPFIGRHINKSELAKLRKEIISYYANAKFPPVVVRISPKFDGGVLQIYIRSKRLENIIFKGNVWWPTEQLREILDLRPGEILNSERIKNHVVWLNQNSFHLSKVKFEAAKTPGDVNLVVTTKDRFPLRFFTTADNSGFYPTGKGRFMGGITWGNVFYRNDMATYELKTSNYADRLTSHTGSYMTWFPWHHRLFAYGNYTVSNPEVPHHNVSVVNKQFKTRYTVFLHPLFGEITQSVAGGFDMKYLSSNSKNYEKPGSIAVIKKLQVTQFALLYSLARVNKKHNSWLRIEAFYSPGKLMPHQSNKTYEKDRPFSKNQYVYGHINAGDIYQLPCKFQFASLFRGQIASGTLPLTELFCIGSYDTVRGYRPCEFASDNGVIANFELRFPVLRPLKYYYDIQDQLTFLCFVDYGWGYNYHPIKRDEKPPKHKKSEYAIGVGPGLRYLVSNNIAFRCDYGFKLHHMQALNHTERKLRGGHGELHIGILMAY